MVRKHIAAYRRWTERHAFIVIFAMFVAVMSVGAGTFTYTFYHFSKDTCASRQEAREATRRTLIELADIIPARFPQHDAALSIANDLPPIDC